jgi:hypothetical protein
MGNKTYNKLIRKFEKVVSANFLDHSFFFNPRTNFTHTGGKYEGSASSAREAAAN